MVDVGPKVDLKKQVEDAKHTVATQATGAPELPLNEE